MAKNSWSIDVLSGHCKHPSGIDTYIACGPYPSYTPVLGPYTSNQKSLTDLAVKTSELIYLSEDKNPKKHFIFGSLATTDNSIEIETLGLKKRWLPDLSARTNWLLKGHIDLPDYELSQLLGREWSLEQDKFSITHSSGYRFCFSSKCFSQSLVRMFTSFIATSSLESRKRRYSLDHITLEEQLHSLGNAGFKALCVMRGISLSARVIQIVSPKQARKQLKQIA